MKNIAEEYTDADAKSRFREAAKRFRHPLVPRLGRRRMTPFAEHSL